MKIIQEEALCGKTEIKSLEEIIQTDLPNDYLQFLLKYNGGIPYPYYPYLEKEDKWFMGIDRFLSCGDLILQKTKLLQYDNIDLIRIHDKSKYKIDIEKFLIIGLCHKGNLLMYYGEEEKGQIYFCSYLDGNGLMKSPFQNFSTLLKNLKENDWDDIDFDNYFSKSNKIFQDDLFLEKDSSNLDWNRFKTVLKFYGDPNQIHKHEEKSVYKKYEWNKELINKIKTLANDS